MTKITNEDPNEVVQHLESPDLVSTKATAIESLPNSLYYDKEGWVSKINSAKSEDEVEAIKNAVQSGLGASFLPVVSIETFNR